MATWGALCGVTTTRQLLDAHRAAAASRPPALLTWNTRWLVDHSTSRNDEKRGLLHRLTKQRVALLQETHWSHADVRSWASQLANRQLVRRPRHFWPWRRPLRRSCHPTPPRLRGRFLLHPRAWLCPLSHRSQWRCLVAFPLYLPTSACAHRHYHSASPRAHSTGRGAAILRRRP